MSEAVIVDAVRTPIGRAFKGSLKDFRADELAAVPLKALVQRNPGNVPFLNRLSEAQMALELSDAVALKMSWVVANTGLTDIRWRESEMSLIAFNALAHLEPRWRAEVAHAVTAHIHRCSRRAVFVGEGGDLVLAFARRGHRVLAVVAG